MPGYHQSASTDVLISSLGLWKLSSGVCDFCRMIKLCVHGGKVPCLGLYYLEFLVIHIPLCSSNWDVFTTGAVRVGHCGNNRKMSIFHSNLNFLLLYIFYKGILV